MTVQRVIHWEPMDMDSTDIGHRAAKAEMGLRLFQSLCQRPDIGQFPAKLAKHPVNTVYALPGQYGRMKAL